MSKIITKTMRIRQINPETSELISRVVVVGVLASSIVGMFIAPVWIPMTSVPEEKTFLGRFWRR